MAMAGRDRQRRGTPEERYWRFKAEHHEGMRKVDAAIAAERLRRAQSSPLARIRAWFFGR